MKKLLPLVLLSATAFAADPGVTGTWTVSGSVQGYPIAETCVLTQTAKQITGTCTGENKTVSVTGTIDGKTVTFTHAGEYQGDPLTLTFSGDLDAAGALKGSIDVQPLNYGGDFTATRAEPKPAPSPVPSPSPVDPAQK